MPYGRMYRRRRNRRNRKRALYRIPRGLTVQTTKTLRHRYTEQLDLAAGNSSTYRLNMNDLYDPEPGMGGGSVSDWADVSSLYSRYRVVAARAIWILGHYGAGPFQYWIETVRDAGRGVHVTYESVLKSGGPEIATHGYLVGSYGATGDGVRRYIATDWIFPYKLLGVDRDDAALGAEITTSPGLVPQFAFNCTSSSTFNFFSYMIVEYVAEWSSPIIQS